MGARLAHAPRRHHRGASHRPPPHDQPPTPQFRLVPAQRGSTTGSREFVRVDPMHRRMFRLGSVVVLLLGVCAGTSGVAVAAGAASAATAQPVPPPPKAYALVDVDTGAVIAQQDARALRPPASTIKLLTALIAAQHLDSSDLIPISAEAEGMPARKINVKA